MHKEYEIGCNEITSINDLIYRLSNIMNVTPKLHFYANNSPYADIKCFAVNFNIKRDINFNDTLEKIYSNYENRN